MLKRLKYVSVATVPFSAEELTQLLIKSQENNARAGVTGGLMMAGRIFFQMLEGPDQAVDAVYQRITRDPRHRSIHLLRNQLTQATRTFPDWSMKLVQPEEVDVRGEVSVRLLMERLELLERSSEQLTSELEQKIWGHFSSVAV